MADGLQDARDYLGNRVFNGVMDELTKAAREAKRDMVASYRICLAFAGVQGIPARAMALEAIRRSNVS